MTRHSSSGNSGSRSSSANATHADATIRELAARQHGVVAREQLVRAGVPAHRIEYRLKTGRLRQLHRAVYRVGPVAGPREREMAAVLACGDTAVLSHDSAAAAWTFAPASAAGRRRSGCQRAAQLPCAAARCARPPRRPARGG